MKYLTQWGTILYVGTEVLKNWKEGVVSSKKNILIFPFFSKTVVWGRS